MQVPSEPVVGESDPHKEPEPAAVKGECRVAVSDRLMLVPTTNMRRGDADMLHHSLLALTTANVSLVCLYLCIHILDHHDGTVVKECMCAWALCVHACVHVCLCRYTHACKCTYVHICAYPF